MTWGINMENYRILFPFLRRLQNVLFVCLFVSFRFVLSCLPTGRLIIVFLKPYLRVCDGKDSLTFSSYFFRISVKEKCSHTGTHQNSVA